MDESVINGALLFCKTQCLTQFPNNLELETPTLSTIRGFKALLHQVCGWS